MRCEELDLSSERTRGLVAVDDGLDGLESQRKTVPMRRRIGPISRRYQVYLGRLKEIWDCLPPVSELSAGSDVQEKGGADVAEGDATNGDVG